MSIYGMIRLRKHKEKIHMIKAVIFDMDGLLIDSEKSFLDIYQEMIDTKGNKEKFELSDYVENYCGKTAVANITRLISQFELDLSIEEGVDMLHNIEHRYSKQGIALKAGAKELIAYLKENGYKIALGTSSNKERAENLLKPNGVFEDFDAVSYGVEVKHGKPAPDIFLNAANKLNLDPESCLVLEDSEAGIQAGHNAHMPVICIPDLKTPSTAIQELTVGCFTSLLDVIDYLEKER